METVAIIIVIIVVWLFIRHQNRLKRRAYAMQEAMRNRDFQFRLSTRGMLWGERAMQEALNNVGMELQRQIVASEVESWQRLTRVLTHEIMNATTPIASISQAFLTREDVRGTALEDGIKAIRDTSEGLNAFVQNYRKLTQLQTPQPTEVHLKEMVDGIATLYPNIDWQITIDDVTVRCDEGMLRQVMINLVKNAVEAGAQRVRIEPAMESRGTATGRMTSTTTGRVTGTATGKVTGRAIGRVPSRMTDGVTGIVISNDGALIPAEMRRDIFTPFFTTKRSGSGIGLSLSRQMMMTQGGDLQLCEVAAPGYNTAFAVVF